jgi:hypothetical protein
MPPQGRDREVALVGSGIAAASAVILLASLFVDWYRGSRLCDVGGCPAATRTGWSALGASSAVMLVAAIAGATALLGVLVVHRGRALLCSFGAIAGLGAALLTVFRIAVVPGSIPGLPEARVAGAFIALLGAVGVVGGSALAAMSTHLFQRARYPLPALATVVIAACVIIASLFMPWVRRSAAVPNGALAFPFSTSRTAWDAAPTMAVLLLLGALAIMCASGLVAAIRWRSSFFALGVGGWLVAGIAATATPAATQVAAIRPGPRMLSYESGYYVCLCAGGVIAAVGMLAAMADSDDAVNAVPAGQLERG